MTANFSIVLHKQFMFLLTLKFHRQHRLYSLDTLSGPLLVTRFLRFISATCIVTITPQFLSINIFTTEVLVLYSPLDCEPPTNAFKIAENFVSHYID